MHGEFKKCPKGHYYQGDKCPYCTEHDSVGSHTQLKTEVFTNGSGPFSTGNYGADDNRTIKDCPTDTPTIADDDPRKTVMPGGCVSQPHRGVSSKTEFGDMSSFGNSGCARYSRKLVGWLVTYSADELGLDFRIYEGRNIIGRDDECDISVDDGFISGRHAVLLFRAGKYSLTDSQSSHGTFVNGEDIELEPRYISDGDLIKIGNTLFKFRSSL